ncbi:hypothetical protein [Rhodopirellula bahusiensis]|uniref:hypothetical protein n=1 Tax=Rhodopirellula bahusiensis TaxID=2014065 RepID=UPI003267F3A3
MSKKIRQLVDPSVALTFVPANINDDSLDAENFSYHSSIIGIRKLYSEKGLKFQFPNSDDAQNTLHLHSADWIAPAIFVTTLYVSQYPDAVSLALSIVANYASELFGNDKESKCQLTIYVETETGKSRQVDFNGPPDALGDVQKLVREISKNG